MIMKKIISLVLIFSSFFLMVGCSIKNKDWDKLSTKKVIQLSQKGTELSWRDFEKYEGKEVGSGLYILKYEVDDEYYLLIGGPGKDERPMYIRLVRNDNKKDYIDIRQESVEEFIKSHNLK